MDKKRPIDIMRERGGSADIGTLEDGAIIEMFDLAGRMLVIKEKAVYEMRMADDIDPKRENLSIPTSSQRLIVSLGTESEIFSRTFLTAKRLFKPEYLPATIDTTQLLFLTLELVQELAALDKEVTDYLNAERKASGDYEDRKSKKLNHTVPSIPDLKTRCKTIFQKVDQAYQAQLALIRIFYPDFNSKSYYSKFLEFIKSRYGEQDNFTKFLESILPFILLARNIRNCLDHWERTETEIKDFDLQLDLSIISPTIEIDYLESKLNRIALSQFLPSVTKNLVTIFENMVAYLCIKNLKADRIMHGQVRFIPEEKRINKYIKFAYWLPIGPEGFYKQ